MPPDTTCELISHTADIGIRVTAPDLPALFEAAARGMLDCLGQLVPDATVSPEVARIILDAHTIADLLRDWLAELLFELERRHATLGYIRFRRLSDTRLEASVEFVPYDRERSAFRNEIKAVTYHQLSVRGSSRGLVAEVIFDI